jgi:hypothetical protein
MVPWPSRVPRGTGSLSVPRGTGLSKGSVSFKGSTGHRVFECSGHGAFKGFHCAGLQWFGLQGFHGAPGLRGFPLAPFRGSTAYTTAAPKHKTRQIFESLHNGDTLAEAQTHGRTFKMETHCDRRDTAHIAHCCGSRCQHHCQSISHAPLHTSMPHWHRTSKLKGE